MLQRATLPVLVLLLAGCGGYRKDLATACDARRLAKIAADADTATRDAALGTFLMLNIHTPKAKKMFARFGSLSRAEQAKILRAEAAKEGVTPCALADEFDPPAKQ